MTDHINIQVNDGIQLVRIQRPERKNALTHAMYTTLNEALLTAQENPKIRTVVITGCEGNFSAGNDMKDFLEHPPQGDDSPVAKFLATLIRFPKPLVAAVEGVAIGVGTTLLLHCDLVYVASDAKLRMPFTSLGLCPEAGSSLLLPLLMGHQRAAELLLLADAIDGKRAVELGLANALSDDCLTLAMAQARRLASLPPASVRLAKRMMRQTVQPWLETQMANESREFFQRLLSPEAREAMTAFMEKREPDFSRFD
jgi:enoyl-CoA hydratase/carnithine racemase